MRATKNMNTETAYDRLQRKKEKQFNKKCNDIMKDKKLSQFEKEFELKCLLGIPYGEIEEFVYNSLQKEVA